LDLGGGGGIDQPSAIKSFSADLTFRGGGGGSGEPSAIKSFSADLTFRGGGGGSGEPSAIKSFSADLTFRGGGGGSGEPSAIKSFSADLTFRGGGIGHWACWLSGLSAGVGLLLTVGETGATISVTRTLTRSSKQKRFIGCYLPEWEVALRSHIQRCRQEIVQESEQHGEIQAWKAIRETGE